jgi:hypothetical protein
VRALDAQAGEQRLEPGLAVPHAAGEVKEERAALSVAADVNLRREAPARAAERLARLTPFAPAACWPARTTVLSIMCCDQSSSPAWSARLSSLSMKCYHSPLAVQR